MELVRLDEEFKKGLQCIRQHILGLSGAKDGILCREWLEKLRQSVDERAVRNQLLQRLIRQLQTGELKAPFDQNPPSGPLYMIFEESEYSAWSDEELHSEIGSRTGDMHIQHIHNLIPMKENVSMKENNTTRLEKRITSLANTLAELRIKYDNLVNENGLIKENKLTLEAEVDRLKKDMVLRDSEISRLITNMESYKKLSAQRNDNILAEAKELMKRVTNASEKSKTIEKTLKMFQTAIHSDVRSKIQLVENEMQAKVNWTTKQIELEKTRYEEHIEHLKCTIEDKDNQIKKLQEDLKTEKNKMKDKLHSMKKTIDKTTRENKDHFSIKAGFFEKKLLKLESINDKMVQDYEKRIINLSKEHKKIMEILMKSIRYREADKLVDEVETKIKNMEESYKRLYNELQIKALEQRSRNNSTSLFTLS